MADNVAITAGAGTTIAADEVVDGTLGTVKVQFVKIMDATLDGTSKAAVGANGLKVDASGATVPVDSELPAAAALADTTANPTTPLVGAAMEMFNGTQWDRVRGDTTSGLWVQTKAQVPGVGATNLGKAEDAVAGDGDTGVAILGVRQDTPASSVSASGDYMVPQLSNLGQMWVVQARPKRIQVTSGGLTTATTAYSANDQVGTLFTVTNMALASGGGGYIESILLSDEAAIIGQYRAWIFRASVTLAADNAAFSLSDADAQLLVGPPIDLGPVYGAVNNNSSGWLGSIPYDCSGGTSLYVALQTLAGHTFFGATTNLKLTLTTSVLG